LSRKKKASGFELFKFRNAKRAFAIFGKPAVELTDAQWLYILNMVLAEQAEQEGGPRGNKKTYIVDKGK
jgi:hypothetical protein